MITRYDKRKTAVEDSAAHAIRYGSENRTLPTPTQSTLDEGELGISQKDLVPAE